MKEDGIADFSASTVVRMLSDLKKQDMLPPHTKFSYYAKSGHFRESDHAQTQETPQQRSHRGSRQSRLGRPVPPRHQAIPCHCTRYRVKVRLCLRIQVSLVNFHTYPRSPKMNAEIEGFNYTLSEAFTITSRGVPKVVDSYTAFTFCTSKVYCWY